MVVARASRPSGSGLTGCSPPNRPPSSHNRWVGAGDRAKITRVGKSAGEGGASCNFFTPRKPVTRSEWMKTVMDRDRLVHTVGFVCGSTPPPGTHTSPATPSRHRPPRHRPRVLATASATRSRQPSNRPGHLLAAWSTRIAYDAHRPRLFIVVPSIALLERADCSITECRQ